MARLNAEQRRHEVIKPLLEWEAQLRHLEKGVRESMTPSPDAPSRKALVREVLRLSDPRAISWCETVIPGGREDLARQWMAARLVGRGAEEDDWRALVREVARPPEEAWFPYQRRGEATRYRKDKQERDVTKAAEHFFRDEPQLA